MNIYLKNAIQKIKKVNSCERKFPSVFLCSQESSEGGVVSIRWRLVGPLADLRSALTSAGCEKKIITPGKIPHCFILDSEISRLEKIGIEKKSAGEIFSDQELKKEIIESRKPADHFPGRFSCEKCGGLEGWLPRAPGVVESDLSQWRCVACKPSPSPQIIAKRCGPAWEASEVVRKAEEAISRDLASQSIVVALERPTCKVCNCSWVVECPTVDGTDRRCWACQSPIDADAFHLAATSPPSWKSKVWKGLTSAGRTEANGAGKEVGGKR